MADSNSVAPSGDTPRTRARLGQLMLFGSGRAGSCPPSSTQTRHVVRWLEGRGLAIRRLHLFVAALVLAIALGLMGVQLNAFGSTAGAQRDGGIFRISINAASGIDYLDPALASTPPAWALLDTTCARLLSYPDK